ncbi:Phage portal protein, SPP1 Gp6-like [Parageobacillus caldoxylosilyticus]|uniref:phage portal protein n=1 Tax=Saccharococcus caldoxylosilyticus TaxID=81408 RepID=UPI001C4DFBEC|nr:phage portal protein [Parageobacillus caldoxylosilyticus]QXJ39577.1 Phage portal protein, SPP1 Gp6-like [Parageobacillus caldoxylosilyticus]
MRSTIQLSVSEVTSDIIKKILDWHKPHRDKMLGLYNRYKGEDLPIQKRVLPDTQKPNNKLENDYRGYIIDQVIGYLFGKPISYSIDKRKYEESKAKEYQDRITHFNTLNTIEDSDAELGTIMSICGYAARLMYIDKNGEERAMNIFPWEAVFVEDGGEITHALRYYTVKDIINDNEYTRVEWYDNKNVTFFIEDDGVFIMDSEGSQPHLFDYVPLIRFQNNDLEKGDFEKVETLIDAYDKIVSDAVNELEQFAHAYMKFKGVSVDKETIDKAKQTGAFAIDSETGDVDFITKDINDTFVENNKKTLNENIHKFSASVDMSDEKFSGATQTGESRKWKLLALENKAGKKARKFSKGLREQFKVLCSAWKKKGIDVDYLDIFWEFKRNIPIDLLYIAEYAPKMKGIHSDHTLLSQIPYIDDVDYELELMRQEQENMINLDLFTNDTETQE